jgi:hypothetical protein
MKIRIYLAQAMTGFTCKSIRQKALKATRILKSLGFEVWSPALLEKVPNTEQKLNMLSKEDLLSKWIIDKNVGMRTCHVIVDIDGDIRSEGVSIERGYMRWYAWRPVVRVKSIGHAYSISDIEDDFIAPSVKQAGMFIKRRWSNRSKWVMWKLTHILFGIPKLIYVQVSSLWL